MDHAGLRQPRSGLRWLHHGRRCNTHSLRLPTLVDLLTWVTVFVGSNFGLSVPD